MGIGNKMKSKYFKLEELVDKKTFEEIGEKAWELIDPRLIESIDAIKARFPEGSMTINSWLWNGDRSWSGLRVAGSPYYSKWSMHSWGKAVDAVFSKYDVEVVRKYILNNPKEFPHIKGVELGVSWLHVDVRNRDSVLAFNP